jgi:hypothetical protein
MPERLSEEYENMPELQTCELQMRTTDSSESDAPAPGSRAPHARVQIDIRAMWLTEDEI